MSKTENANWWETINPHKNCSYCGAIINQGVRGWFSIGKCKFHQDIFEDDIKSGFKQNRLRQIMIDRGEIKDINHTPNIRNETPDLFGG